ncbi:T9SS type A sorting domain-containing protein [candidate division KSB1 bacterium]|nr:T9SS type A sorting domain-containing protein [candidate division KSB1 bacterium]
MDNHRLEFYGFLDPSAGNAEDTPTEGTPHVFELIGAFPNPVSREATIEYRLFRPARVSLKIYNARGREIATLKSDYLMQGVHRLTWQRFDDTGRLVPSGVYWLRLVAGGQVVQRKSVVVK